MQSHAALIDDFRRWTATELPRLNTAVETAALAANEFVEAGLPWIERVRGSTSCGALTAAEARRLMGPITFVVNSVERHLQAAGDTPGAGLARLPGSEGLLLRLSFQSGLPAHGSVYTVWLENRTSPILTFTGDPQEKFFHASVLRTDELSQQSCEALRRITTEGVALESREAVEALELATRNAQALRKIYSSFMVPDPQTGFAPITPSFFSTRMRTYLVSYPVAGRSVSGGNAGDLPSALALDYLIGTTTNRYEGDVISRRLPNLTAQDRDALRADMTRPSVFGLLTERLEKASREAIEDGGFAFSSFPSELRATARAFGSLVKAHGDASATHFGLIQNFLVRFERERSQAASVPTPMDRGTGGISHSVTERIMRMRREHPAVNWRNG